MTARWALTGAAALLVACAPALDWRDVTPAARDWVVQLPCKPQKLSRAVALAGGAPVQMTMWACSAQKMTFAVAAVDVHDPARVPAVLDQLKRSVGERLAHIDVIADNLRWMVSGRTPQPAEGRWRGQGTAPDGRKLMVETGVVSRGTQVLQATVMGEQMNEAAREQFFDGVAFRLPQ